MSAAHHGGGDHQHGDHHHHHHHRAGVGPAVLDIGGDVGALVATMPPGTAGTELFLRFGHDYKTTVHTGVWDRHDLHGEVTVAVFPELYAGTYEVLDERSVAVRSVEIRGGEVTRIDLRP